MYILLLILSHKDNTRSGSFDFQPANNSYNIPIGSIVKRNGKRTLQFLKNGFGGKRSSSRGKQTPGDTEIPTQRRIFQRRIFQRMNYRITILHSAANVGELLQNITSTENKVFLWSLTVELSKTSK